ncbi:MAG: hypothetical protein HDS35_01055 [Bacteroides sp.]|nr:hypothetical protein [Bacteroides sp.]
MERDILEKTAAYYAREANVTKENFELTDLENAVIVGAEFVMGLSLRDRLTPEEKKIMKEHGDKLIDNYMKAESPQIQMYWKGCIETHLLLFKGDLLATRS